MTRSEAKKLLAMLALAFDNETKPVVAELYVEGMLDLDVEPAARGVKRIIGTERFFPRLAQIREATFNEDRDGGNDSMEGAEAWSVVCKAISRVGMYRTPTFDDQIIAHCVECFGWQELCLSENAVADRARFIELYNQIVKRNERKETYQRAQLMGFHGGPLSLGRTGGMKRIGESHEGHGTAVRSMRQIGEGRRDDG